MKPILFLDFDGVLNGGSNRVEPLLVARLNEIVNRSQCEVVVSSAWRIHGVERLRVVLAEAGYTGTLRDVTPSGGCSEHFESGWRCEEAHRGHEILEWFRTNYPDGVIPPFAILDDSADLHPFLHNHVHTRTYVGLIDRDVEQAVQVLAEPADRLCAGCWRQVDDTTCWCGEGFKYHRGSEHGFVPAGCECVRRAANPRPNCKECGNKRFIERMWSREPCSACRVDSLYVP